MSNNNSLIGHIDLVQIKSNKLIIADYKPERESLVTSLPQVLSYGLMAQIYIGLNSKDIICISLNKKEAWAYNTEILLSEVKNFVVTQNQKRKKVLIDLSWVNYFL